MDRRSEGIPRYTNAQVTMFVTEETIVATGGRFVKILVFVVVEDSKWIHKENTKNL